MRHWLRPGLVGLHVLAAAAVAFCVGMGLWQLGIYEGRQGDAQDGARREVVPLADVWRPGEAFTSELRHKRVSLEGRFASDNVKVMRDDGATWLVTPFVIGDHALLVVRGEGERAPASDATELDVVLEPSESGGRALGPDRTTDAISVPALINDLPQRLYGGYGIALTDTGLPLVKPPEPEVSVDGRPAQPRLRPAVVGVRRVRVCSCGGGWPPRTSRCVRAEAEAGFDPPVP